MVSDFLDRIGPESMPRVAPAYYAIKSLLSDGQWHRVDEVRQAGLDASDLASRTVDNLIRWGHKRGQRSEWRYRGKGAAKELRRR